MPRVTLAHDYECDIFGLYVDGKLVYDYDETNTSEMIEVLCQALGVEYEHDTKGFGSEKDNPDCTVPSEI